MQKMDKWANQKYDSNQTSCNNPLETLSDPHDDIDRCEHNDQRILNSP